jgi:nucleotidyltransferase substrate binding protein (TIGR01987 family)
VVRAPSAPRSLGEPALSLIHVERVTALTVARPLPDNAGMSLPTIDLAPLRRALALLNEALRFWNEQAEGAPLKPHLRSSVIQSFEFTYELAVRSLRRVLIERSASAERVAELSFNDLLRAAADSGFMPDTARWREWREMRNATSHAYDEAKAQAVAQRAAAFAVDAASLLGALEASLAG